METRVESTTYGDIEFNIYGSGYPILFLHGGHSNAKETLTHKHIDPTKFILITPSRPGYGHTVLKNNQSPIDAAKQIMELMDKLSFDQFNVIGISAGGLTAIALVALNPHRINKFVMASSISKKWLRPEDELYQRAKKMFNPNMEKYTWGLLHFCVRFFPKAIVKKMAAELTTVEITHIAKDEVSDIKTMLLSQRSKSGFVTDIDQDLDESLLEKIKTPTLILHSKNDKAVSGDHPKHAASKIGESELVWVENKWGHLIWAGQESKNIIDRISLFLSS